MPLLWHICHPPHTPKIKEQTRPKNSNHISTCFVVSLTLTWNEMWHKLVKTYRVLWLGCSLFPRVQVFGVVLLTGNETIKGWGWIGGHKVMGCWSQKSKAVIMRFWSVPTGEGFDLKRNRMAWFLILVLPRTASASHTGKHNTICHGVTQPGRPMLELALCSLHVLP